MNGEREYLTRVSAALREALADVVDHVEVTESEEADVLVVRASGDRFGSPSVRRGAEYLVEEFGLQHGLSVSTTVHDDRRVYTLHPRPGVFDPTDSD
ncbi:hypothetical protein [Candidatus Halobonum tyrrellensis]|uniref:Uncharacterized protein n=1 Tax=Candidatus Halobonum tyrrellensis G22 TaxID=1324957 RepID=V4HJW7_9EURY|nr:hypothetical protein [Candidatus Halobonum tyrrellensis]ESP90063.1 hypothetical protein K933_00832 [Candidatus Halobonum tyrrellensis G22]